MPRPVQTVLGDIGVEDLGFTLPHERVLHDMYELTMSSQLILNDKRLARTELLAYKEAGRRTLVDQTIYGMNPNPKGSPKSRETSASISSPARASTGESSIHHGWPI
jgi:hypothetical protein